MNPSAPSNFSNISGRRGSALSFDALFTHGDYVFDRRAPEAISVEIEPRQNSFVALCRRFHAGDDEMILNTALTPETDYTYDGKILTVKTRYLMTLPVGEYAVLSAVFSRGQSAVFSVYSRPAELQPTYILHDFSALTDEILQKGYKNEYFKSLSLDRTVSREGRASVRLEYDFTLWPKQIFGYFEMYKNEFIRCPRPRAISVWIYGDGSGNVVTMRLYNRYRSCVFPVNDILLDWQGWKKVYFEFSEEIALPVMWNELLRLECGRNASVRAGAIYLDRFEAVCDEAEVVENRMGVPREEPLHAEDALGFDFEGITKGATTTFRLACAGGYRPAAPVLLECLSATDRNGAPLPFQTEPLPFDQDGTLKTDLFTAPSLPEDSAFALRVTDAAGEQSSVLWLVTASKSDLYPRVPCNIIRNITKSPQTSAAFSCSTSIDSPTCLLAYRKSGEPASSEKLVTAETHGAREAVETVNLHGVPVTLDREHWAHAVCVDGLEPGTEYVYRLGSEGSWTKETKFRTFSDKRPYFDAVILADAHNGRSKQFFERYRRVISDGVRRTQEQLLFIELGDMVNTATDLVDYLGTLTASRKYFTAYPFAPTPGNHERDVMRWFKNYASHWNLPDCGIAKYRNLFYSFDLYDYHFTSLCADGVRLEPDALEWIENDLKGTDKKWKVVMMHCSPYGGKGVQSFNRLHIAPILDRYDVDLCLSAHEHIYVRSSMRGGKRVPLGEGVAYLTMGTSGPKAYENAKHDWQDFVYGDKYSERFIGGVQDITTAVAHFSPERIVIDVQMISGRVVDYVVLEK